MGLDISRILDGWSYDPDDVRVRIVTGDDGREKIQLRLDLGLLQMEMDGRPDGTRPEGVESWLDVYEAKAAKRATRPDASPLKLSHEDCQRLLAEGVQYYHRYVSFWNLKRYDLCARDTARNLRLFAFVRAHARHERDKLLFDQWRPYVLMMHARAVATPFVARHQLGPALAAIDAGITGIRDFLAEYNQEDRADSTQELVQLERWRDELLAIHEGDRPEPATTATTAATPATPGERLRADLLAAVADERYEDAARLRDQLRALDGDAETTPGDAD